MAYTGINSEDRLVQKTFADHLHDALGWDSVYAWNEETFGPDGTLGRNDTREVVLKRDLRAGIARLNPGLPDKAIEEAVTKLTRYEFTRSLLQHNQEFYNYIRDGVPVSYRDASNQLRETRAHVIDFENGPGSNRFLAVRELKITGMRPPSYNCRADLVCFVNGLPLVSIELKAVYKNIRDGFENNLRHYLDEAVIGHAFHHNALLIVSNGHRAKYGSITSEWEHFAEWKRNDERDKGGVDAEVLLNGMLAQDRLLDLVANFILFDSSKPGGTRKIVAKNHQYLGANNAVASVRRQEELKRQFPVEERLRYRVAEVVVEAPELGAAAEGKTKDPSTPVSRAEENAREPSSAQDAGALERGRFSRRPAARELELVRVETREVKVVERVHPDLGQLGVFWHTQGSGKSYSMGFFAEKVRRWVPGNFTFLIMTDRNDLDDQIYRTFVGCGIVDKLTPRASSGEELKRLLQEDHRYIFSLIHKFNQDVDPEKPYSKRDDIIVVSDEAHRTQSGKLARNMRLALPNASFIGFTGTPLFKNDQLTARIFGKYVSRYDFKRSEEDGNTKKLVYDNRGEKLGIARLDLNDRIAEKVEEAELDPDQEALLEKLLGQDYEVVTADDRLDKLANDFVDYCAKRWESGKSMLVCIDKITCARMYQRIIPRWQAKSAEVEAAAAAKAAELAAATDSERRKALDADRSKLLAQAKWLRETIIEIIISEAQNEVADFKKWDFDIIPHRVRMKQGFEMANGKTIPVDLAFKDAEHPFRIAIVCAMWLTGFDVESLSTLYIDKPMKAHTLMQAIARANRVYPGKDFGLIVDYNGMLKSLRAALAQYALGDDADAPEEIVAPIEERILALQQALDEIENHLRSLGFEPSRLKGAKGFAKISALADAVEALYKSDESKRRFEIMARQVFIRFKSLVMEPSVFVYAERHDNIEAIYKKLEEKRDTADVTAVLKELHKIVNEAIRTQQPGEDRRDGRLYDLSQIDLAKLRDEFGKVQRKRTTLEDIRTIVERKLQQMIARNPQRMDYYRKYSEIVADYNREKDRVTIEQTFAQLLDLVKSLDAEQVRAAEEGLSEQELAMFDLLRKDNLTKVERDRIKEVCRSLYAHLTEVLASMDRWTEKEQTQSDVKVIILDELYQALPTPPFSEAEKEEAAERIYQYIWQQSAQQAFGASA